ncbi:MAG: hypothetical protein AAGB51_00090 [Planctomycetota bacterium]
MDFGIDGPKSVRRFLGVLGVAAIASASGAQVVDDLGLGFLDHEIFPEENLVVYQTPDDEVWIRSLDPTTGSFVPNDDRLLRVDIGIDPLTASKNGPEFGIDRDGWSVFYNKTADGLLQVWRATLTSGVSPTFVPEQLSGPPFARINQLPSQSFQAATTYVLYGRDNPSNPSSIPIIAWFDEAAPNNDNFITKAQPGFAGFRWVDETTLYTSTLAHGDDAGQIVLRDASGGGPGVITNDPGTKFDPYAWVAPEFGDELRVVASIDTPGPLGTPQQALAVYEPLANEQYWVRTAVLEIPASSGMTHVQSPEPFVAGGRSFVVVTLKDADGGVIDGDVTESQVWLFDLNDDPERRFAVRCDDGDLGPIAHEGEAFAGTNELFIYYNYVRRIGGIGLAVTSTGIGTDGRCASVDIAPPYGTVTNDDVLRQIDLVNTGDPAADFNHDTVSDFFDLLGFLAAADACVVQGQPSDDR